MVRRVDEHYRIIRKAGIEVVARHLPAFGEIAHVIAVTDDPFAGLGVEFCLVGLERRDDVRDVTNRAGGHARDIRPLHELRGVHEVPVRLDEGWHERRALEIDHRGGGGLVGHDLSLVTRGEDFSPGNGNRGNLRPCIDHCEDRAIVKDQIGGVGHGGPFSSLYQVTISPELCHEDLWKLRHDDNARRDVR